MDKFNYGIVAVELNKPDKNDLHEILHFVGYWDQPTEDDVSDLMNELKTDESFGLTNTDFDLIPASQEIIDYYCKEIEKNE